MILGFKTRDGHEAYECGDRNRFGFTPFEHYLRADFRMIVWHDADGAARDPCDPNLDSMDFVQLQKVERDELQRRRLKDNWL